MSVAVSVKTRTRRCDCDQTRLLRFPFHILQRRCGCNAEFYTVSTPAGSTPLLVNDSTNAASVKVYMVSTVAPPYISDAQPTMNNDTVIQRRSCPGRSPIPPLPLTKAKSLLRSMARQWPDGGQVGGVTTVTQPAPAAFWPIGANTIELAFADNLGTNFTYSYGFSVATYSVMDVSEMVPLGSQDTTSLGLSCTQCRSTSRR